MDNGILSSQAIEPDAVPAARPQWQLEAIAKGHAEIDVGLGIELEDLLVWFDQLEIDENAPLPVPPSQR
jgi:predicted transcriptional regulator